MIFLKGPRKVLRTGQREHHPCVYDRRGPYIEDGRLIRGRLCFHVDLEECKDAIISVNLLWRRLLLCP